MRRLVPVLALLALPLAASCSSDPDPAATPTATRSQPAESAFGAGSCRLAAPDVLAVARDADRLGDEGTVPDDVKEALRVEQDRLAALTETADPAVKPVLDRLVVAIGLVRVRADGNTYEPALGADLLTAYDAVVSACTAPGPAASAG